MSGRDVEDLAREQYRRRARNLVTRQLGSQCQPSAADLDQDHVDYGYALTGHKAQGVTTGHTFTIIDGGTDRGWAYMAMSRGRHTNTLYLVNPKHDRQCTHLTYPEPREALDALTASLGRSSARTAAINHLVGTAPPNSDAAERVAWIVARHRAEPDELERTPPAIELAAER